LSIIRNPDRKIKVSFKFDKNVGYFRLIPIYIYDLPRSFLLRT
jgi:hypothetical protein